MHVENISQHLKQIPPKIADLTFYFKFFVSKSKFINIDGECLQIMYIIIAFSIYENHLHYLLF